MKRRDFIAGLGGSALSLALLNSHSIAQFKSNFQIREVRDGVYIYTNRGGTIMFTSTDKGWVVVDTQFPAQSKELIGELKNMKPSPIGLLINTHHHGDHSAGNIAFKGLVDEVVAHENSLFNQKKSAETKGNEADQLYPTTTYSSSWRSDLGGERVILRHFGAGHTNGDSWVHFEKANVVHTGDMLFNRRHPYIDKSAGAMVSSWIEVLETVINTFENDTKFVFGHAGDGYDVIGSKSDLKAFQSYLQQAYVFVEKKLKSGLSPDEVKAITEFDFQSEWSGNGISRVLNALVEELR